MDVIVIVTTVPQKPKPRRPKSSTAHFCQQKRAFLILFLMLLLLYFTKLKPSYVWKHTQGATDLRTLNTKRHDNYILTALNSTFEIFTIEIDAACQSYCRASNSIITLNVLLLIYTELSFLGRQSCGRQVYSCWATITLPK